MARVFRVDETGTGRHKHHLPRVGPLPKPRSRAGARLLLRKESFSCPGVLQVRLEAHEFTSLCPRTGQPDFASVVIEYEPRKRCVESRSLKYYLWSFREERAFCETLAAQIADDIVFAVSPESLRVEIHQSVRGGIAVIATATR